MTSAGAHTAKRVKLNPQEMAKEYQGMLMPIHRYPSIARDNSTWDCYLKYGALARLYPGFSALLQSRHGTDHSNQRNQWIERIQHGRLSYEAYIGKLMHRLKTFASGDADKFRLLALAMCSSNIIMPPEASSNKRDHYVSFRLNAVAFFRSASYRIAPEFMKWCAKPLVSFASFLATFRENVADEEKELYKVNRQTQQLLSAIMMMCSIEDAVDNEVDKWAVSRQASFREWKQSKGSPTMRFALDLDAMSSIHPFTKIREIMLRADATLTRHLQSKTA